MNAFAKRFVPTCALVFSCFVLPLTAHAEIEEGRAAVSWSADISAISFTYEDPANDFVESSYATALEFGYFLFDNHQVGGRLEMEGSTDGYDATSAVYLYGFYKLYFTPADSDVAYFIGGQGGLGAFTFTDDTFATGDTLSASVLAVGFFGGMSHFVSENLSFDYRLDYYLSSIYVEAVDEDIVVVDNLLSVGMTYYFDL